MNQQQTAFTTMWAKASAIFSKNNDALTTNG
jgi:hypothetical protein